MSGFKRQRTGEMVLGCLSRGIRQCEDPRFLGISLTAVEMSPDLKQARVFWSLFNAQAAVVSPTTGEPAASETPSQKAIRSAHEALDGIASSLKRQIASELNLRYTPRLIFAYDPTIATAARIEQLMKDSNFQGTVE